MQVHNEHRHAHAAVAHAEMNGVAWKGLLLALAGLVAFGGYTAFFLAGFISDLMR